MIHLVRSIPRAYSGASSSTTLSIAEPTEKPAEVIIPVANPDDESMTSRALIVLEHLGAMYPVETSQAIAPVTMSPTMKDLYQNLTVQQVAFNHPNTVTVQPDRLKLPANTPFVQDYPSQMLQAPVIPVRARKILPPLPFLEVGSGLLAFTIVSGVVVVDGFKQAQNGPGKRVSPISSSVNDRTTRVAQAKAGMSDMEVLKSDRTLPVPGLAMGAPTGLSMGGMNLTPAQMSQLAMQQAIAPSKVGTSIAPPISIIPTLNPLPQTGEALPAVPAVPAAVPQGSAPQSISLSPPIFRPLLESALPKRQPIRQPARPTIVTQPMALPVPALPLSSAAEAPIAPPSPPIAPSPSPSTAMPIVRQSMTLEPAEASSIEERPRQAVPAQSSATPPAATQAAIQDEAAAMTLTPRVLTSMRPETSDSIAPASLKPAASQDVVPKDLVFKQKIN
ncbi:MAG: hypothetical protein H7237_07325 [Alkalinema sp. FL-bin-369]|nr:hypothetical protein [Leptolyngbyaceae cyanobacterium LF-bin-369]